MGDEATLAMIQEIKTLISRLDDRIANNIAMRKRLGFFLGFLPDAGEGFLRDIAETNAELAGARNDLAVQLGRLT